MKSEELYFSEMTDIDQCLEGDDWWTCKRRDIIALAKSGASPYQFYTWPPVINTMWPNTDGYAVFQVKFLKNLGDFNARWFPAMRDKIKVTSSQWWKDVSFASITHAYIMAHFETVARIDLNEMCYVFEFGAGVANMCRIIHNLGFKGHYEIFDFPEMRPLQKFFLTESGIDISGVRWLDSMNDASIPNNSNRLMISIAAIEETPRDIQPIFIEMGKRFTHFMTGGSLMHDVHIKLHEVTDDTTKWQVWDTSIPPQCFIGIGYPKL